MKDLIDSLLIGTLATYLPFWIIDSATQRIALAIGLSMLIYFGKLWLLEREKNENKKDPQSDSSGGPNTNIKVLFIVEEGRRKVNKNKEKK